MLHSNSDKSDSAEKKQASAVRDFAKNLAVLAGLSLPALSLCGCSDKATYPDVPNQASPETTFELQGLNYQPGKLFSVRAKDPALQDLAENAIRIESHTRSLLAGYLKDHQGSTSMTFSKEFRETVIKELSSMEKELSVQSRNGNLTKHIPNQEVDEIIAAFTRLRIKLAHTADVRRPAQDSGTYTLGDSTFEAVLSAKTANDTIIRRVIAEIVQ